MSIEKHTTGFGTDLAKIAKRFKVDVAADKIARALGYVDCDCSKRKDALNNPDLLINKIFYKDEEK